MLARSPIYDPTRILLAAGGRIALRLLLVSTALLMISLLVTVSSTTTPNRRSHTRTELANLRNAIEAYFITQGCSPPDIQALVEAGVLRVEPSDGWEQPLTYRRSWDDPREIRFTVCSLGKDGALGTGDDLCLGGMLFSQAGLPT